MNISSMQYAGNPLRRKDLCDDPFKQFDRWFEEAISKETFEPHAMVLATVDKDGGPDARAILLKGFDEQGFVFYTNFESAKARQLESNNKVAILFLWKQMMRQVRIHGVVEKVSPEESAEYFKSRPRESRLGAWASPQSKEVGSREEMDAQYRKIEEKFSGKEVPLPDFWGGYRVKPNRFEFWQGQPNRLHDRFLYELKGSVWGIKRLAP